MRISAQSWVKGGWCLADSMRLAKELEFLGAAFIHVWACGLFERTDSAPAFTPLYQADYAKSVKQAVSIPVIAARLITKASEGEALLLGTGRPTRWPTAESCCEIQILRKLR